MNETKRLEIEDLTSNLIIKNKFKGIYVVTPEVGIHKATIESFNKISEKKKILILVPYNSMIDLWTIEIKLWTNNLHEYEVFNQRSIRRLDLSKFDHIIVYEIGIGSQFQQGLLLAYSDRIMGLSGFLTKEVIKELKDNLELEVKYSYTIDQAITDGLVSNFMIVKVPILPSLIRNVRVNSDMKEGLYSEREIYQNYTETINKWKESEKTNSRFKSIRMSWEKKRDRFLFTSLSKLYKAREIITKVTDRAIIVTNQQFIAQELCENSYTGKSDENKIEEFMEDSIDKLSVTSLSEIGASVSRLKVAIVHQVDLNDPMFIQRVMRTLSYNDGQNSLIYILYYQGTIDEEFVENSLKVFSPNKIKYLTR